MYHTCFSLFFGRCMSEPGLKEAERVGLKLDTDSSLVEDGVFGARGAWGSEHLWSSSRDPWGCIRSACPRYISKIAAKTVKYLMYKKDKYMPELLRPCNTSSQNLLQQVMQCFLSLLQITMEEPPADRRAAGPGSWPRGWTGTQHPELERQNIVAKGCYCRIHFLECFQEWDRDLSCHLSLKSPQQTSSLMAWGCREHWRSAPGHSTGHPCVHADHVLSCLSASAAHQAALSVGQKQIDQMRKNI